MKKFIITAAFLFLIFVPFNVFAGSGELTFKTDGGFTVFSDGVGECDGFGFAVSDGDRVLHLYIIGEASQPFSAKLDGMADSETEIRQFTESAGVFAYGTPYYVTNKTEIVTLDEIKSGLITALGTVVDKNLYRDAERQEIERIIALAEASITESQRRYPADEAFVQAKTDILKLRTDEELKADELIRKRASAITEISGFADKELYRPAEQSIIQSIIDDAVQMINTLTDLDEIDSRVSEAKKQISALKTNAQYEAEELEELKQSKIAELAGLVDISDYRPVEQAEIERIISEATEVIRSATSKTKVTEAFENAKNAISGMKTDADYSAEELAAAKASAIAGIVGYLDKSLYREAEQLTIDGIISESTAGINSATSVEEVNGVASDAVAKLGLLLTDEELKANAAENSEVLYYLNKAVAELLDTRFVGKEKKLINIVVPVMKLVIADGDYGRIIITPEYVKSAYSGEVSSAREIYNSMSEDIERPAFEQKLAQLDMETQAFLKEYFL